MEDPKHDWEPEFDLFSTLSEDGRVEREVETDSNEEQVRKTAASDERVDSSEKRPSEEKESKEGKTEEKRDQRRHHTRGHRRRQGPAPKERQAASKSEQDKTSSSQKTSTQKKEISQQRQQQGGGTEISVVIPLYNERDSLKELAAKLKSVLNRSANRWEVWFVDDGSIDGSYDALRELNRSDRRFKVIQFRRNFGKSAALSIGFHHARGNHVITMDADLQDDPEEIPRLIEKMNSGYDLVSGWKKKRKDPITKTIPSKFFNFVTGKISGIKIHDFNCGLKGYRKEVVKSVQLYGEMHRYIPVLVKMAGFSVSEIPVTHHPRKYGRTKFGMSRFYKGFLDLITVMFTSRYNQRPLHLFGTIGLILFLIGVGINVYLSVEWWMGHPISNRPMLFLGILLILVGILSVSTGLLAEMVTKSQHASMHYPVKNVLK